MYVIYIYIIYTLWEYSTTPKPKIIDKINFIKLVPSTKRSRENESDQRLSIKKVIRQRLWYHLFQFL